MPNQHLTIIVVLCTIILFACNQQQKNIAVNKPLIAAPSFDRVNVLPDVQLNIADYNNLFEQNNTQRFTAQSKNISIITGRKGVKITVDPAVLEKEDGTAIDGKINVSIIELTNIDELFKSNAATNSNGKLLFSGGSYFVGMRCNGQALHIKTGRSIEMQFPKIKEEEMQLFYGERNISGDMNWKQASYKKRGLNTEQEEELMFTDNDRYSDQDYLPGFIYDENKKPKIYKTLNDPVYYYQRKTTIKELVDTINRNELKIYIDTFNAWPGANVVLEKGQYIDTNYLFHRYGPCKQYKLITYKYLKDEAERLAKEKLARERALTNWQPQTLSGQLQKYYSPSKITSLGWINCDHFYEGEQTETYFDLPITLNKGSVNYFVLIRSENGLLSGRAQIDSAAMAINKLPAGLQATLIAFIKKDGQVFHCKEDFVVQKNKRVKLNFKNISPEEMTRMFGNNVKI